MKFTTTIYLLITATILDALTTLIAVSLGAEELNPTLNWLTTHTSMFHALIIAKALFIFVILPLFIAEYNKGNQTTKQFYHATAKIMAVIVTAVVILNCINISMSYGYSILYHR